MKNAVIITIGDEILSGNTVDTNSNFIANELKSIGISVHQIFTISDDIGIIKRTLQSAFQIADVVITTGGLGPTRDDKTKIAFAEFFNDTLVRDEVTYHHLSDYFTKKNRLDILQHSISQADVLSKATVFQNDYGSAPCQMMYYGEKLVFSLPGVPYEVKPLMKDKIIPHLKKDYLLDAIYTRVVSVVNIAESILAERISHWEDHLPKHISLSYLPIGNRVKLRITAVGNSLSLLTSDVAIEISKLLLIIGDNVIATYEDKIEKILGEMLTNKNLTISTAESCTGGEVMRLISSVAGSSAYFLGGVTTYATKLKSEILKVSKATINEHSVVSEAVALEMARGGQQLFSSNICIATTGVAGPSRGEDGQDVGTVFYAIRFGEQVHVSKLFLPHLDRQDFIQFVSQRVLQDIVSILANQK